MSGLGLAKCLGRAMGTAVYPVLPSKSTGWFSRSLGTGYAGRGSSMVENLPEST